MSGWIKLHRSLIRWEWYSDHNTTRLFLHMLMKANHEDKVWRGVDIPSGSFITSRSKLASETGLSEQQVRAGMRNLQATSEIASKPTNKYSMIEVLNWSSYQQANQQEPPNPTTNKKNKKKEYGEFLKLFNKAADKNCRVLDDKTKRQITARIKDGYTVDEIIKATEFCKADDYHKKHRKYLTPEFITRADKLAKYLPANSQSTAFRQTGQNFHGQPVCNGLTQAEHITKYGSLSGENNGSD